MKTNGFLLDTTALIEIFHGIDTTAELVTELSGEAPLASCPVIIAEIYSGIRETEILQVDEFLKTLTNYQIGIQTAQRAGFYRRVYRKKGLTLGLADCLIAAVAVDNALTLITKNIKQYPMPELMVISH